MAANKRCSECNALLSESTPYSLCPKCLMQIGLENDATGVCDKSPTIEGPGTSIGHYELLELIGEGGMGLVYLAEQHEPIQRKVALKIVKLGMDTMQVVARFRAEQQTLALLDHPNIAKVFDAGTTESGRPYFVMEYVQGTSITKYCDDRKLAIEERLRLFKEVCEGVHHAHQKGIIHRDIKPSNVLVSTQDDRRVPKIIDFGVAKALTEPLVDATSFTREGQLLGTPEYMSPEQVDLATADIDTRSDIYSLGVLLYELLAGVMPFDRESFKCSGFAEIQKTIREEEPVTPSTRLTSLGEKAKEIAKRRRTQLLTLARRLHRELEWIPMKAMRKDRTRRYSSASELADDIQNYLTGAPLMAGPESSVYRARKFMRKHAGSVTTAALVAVAIILGLVASIIMGCRADKARRNEASARKQVEQTLIRSENAERVAKQRAEEYRCLLYCYQISHADMKCREGDTGNLHRLLKACPKDLRGWEWNRLDFMRDQSLRTLGGPQKEVSFMGFSPDGQRILGAVRTDRQVNGDGIKAQVRVWDAATGEELADEERIMTITSVEGDSIFYPDHERLISSGGWDGTMTVWDTKTGSQVTTLKGHADLVRSVALSPDGKRIATGSLDKTVKLWNASTGENTTTLNTGNRVVSVAFNHQGNYIAASGDNGMAKVWDVATGKPVMALTGHKGPVWSIAFSPNDKHIVSGAETVKVWDASTGTLLKTISGCGGFVDYSPNGDRIVAVSNDNNLTILDAESGDALMTLRGHTGAVGSVAFSPDGKRIVSCGGGVMKIWDATIDTTVMALRGHRDHVRQVTFSADGKRILSGGHDGTIKIWDASSGIEKTTILAHDSWIYSVVFSPDGKRIVSGGEDKTIKMWDAASGAEQFALSDQGGPVYALAFSPSGNRIVSGGYEGQLKTWDATSGAEVMALEGQKGLITAVAYSPDGKRIVSGGSDKNIKVWDAETGAEIMTLLGHSGTIFCIAYSPDGRWIVSGSADKTLRIWNADDGAEARILQGHKGTIWSLGISPDSRRLVSGGHGVVKIWDIETGSELLTLGKQVGVYTVAFSPDGKRIVSGGMGGEWAATIKVWESTRPIEGYEPRRTGAAARQLVEKLHGEYGLYSKVIDTLKTDETLKPSVRKAALQIAQARLAEDHSSYEYPRKPY